MTSKNAMKKKLAIRRNKLLLWNLPQIQTN